MRVTTIVAFAALALGALASCGGRDDDARLGRPGDPGYVQRKSLGQSSVHAGPIEGQFVGATFHVAYYQQAEGQPPVLGLEYGAFDVHHGGYWLHVALWAEGELPADVDLATYRAKSPYGELERAQVEFSRTLDADADLQDLRHAVAGHLRFEIDGDRARLELTDLEFDDPQDLGPPALVGGIAEGDVTYQCYLYDLSPDIPEPASPGDGVAPLPNPNLTQSLYTEDRDRSSKFCAALLR
jgi:hypothetical protein